MTGEIIPLTQALLTRARERREQPQFRPLYSKDLRGDLSQVLDSEPDEFDTLHCDDSGPEDAA